MACARPALAQAPQGAAPSPQARAFAARLIAEAGAGRVFADASTGSTPQARHLASGVVCRFALARPASIKLLPARDPQDNVGCTMGRGTGILALQVQRVPATLEPARFLTDMVEVVHTDFPDAAPIAPPARAPAVSAHFSATLQGRPVYVEVTAVRAGPWMISGHMVAPRQDAESADSLTRAEVEGAVSQAALK